MWLNGIDCREIYYCKELAGTFPVFRLSINAQLLTEHGSFDMIV
jgi:hypothetical protein